MSVAIGYNQIPYESKPYFGGHPWTMRSVAAFHGVLAPDPSTQPSRVLELGCANGGNSLSIAMTLPLANILGIDLGETHITDANDLAKAAGLTNAEYRVADLMEVDDSYGMFDYIICHGVYSWVEPAIQTKIMKIFQERLTDDGLGYVSYNVYPGWHRRMIVRDAMCIHTQGITDPHERVARARGYLGYLATHVIPRETDYGITLREEAERLAEEPDYYLFHELLEDTNDPLYFQEFCRRLQVHDLNYIAEVAFPESPDTIQGESRGILDQISANWLDREQTFDFLTCRTFRRSLICKNHHEINRNPDPEILGSFRLLGLVKPVAGRERPQADQPAEFLSSKGATIQTNDPVVAEAFNILNYAWPLNLRFSELWRHTVKIVQQTTGQAPEEEDRTRFIEAMMRAVRTRLVEPQLHKSLHVSAVSDRPKTSPLALKQAELGRPVFCLDHHLAQCDDFHLAVLALLDGARDHDQITDVLFHAVMEGKLIVEFSDEENAEQSKESFGLDLKSLKNDPTTIHRVVAQLVPVALKHLAKQALLY